MSDWRLAKSLETLREQINAACPNRNKSSDGTIGDAAHASRTSDHNPWVKDGSVGVVTAMDITNDPAHGVNCAAIAETLLDHYDPRIKYVIWNRRIWTPAKGTQWRPYTGINPHDKHMHISVESAKAYYDDAGPWNWGGPMLAQAAIAEASADMPPLIYQGIVGHEAEIARAKAALVKALEGEAGFGPLMDGLARGFQKHAGLVADGKIGAYTWEKLPV